MTKLAPLPIRDVDDLISADVSYPLSLAVRPGDLDVHGRLGGAQAEMQGQVVLVSLAGPSLDLPGVDSLFEFDANLTADRRTVYQAAIALEPNLEPGIRVSLVDEQLARRDQSQAAVAA